ncbi:hypothetical protein POTOM_046432 [Populus tomentosa]|nr:hypothetical protein POTOM_046432 [Populus tomentosa]
MRYPHGEVQLVRRFDAAGKEVAEIIVEDYKWPVLTEKVSELRFYGLKKHNVRISTVVAMGRMHSKGKGISASALPYKRTSPSWLKISPQDVDDNICKFAKKGLTPSQIGVILRDSHGIAQVKTVTGNQILRILKAHGLAPEIPEDLYHLIKKAVAIRKHLERNRKDKDSKFRLILVESRIHRLARYYKKTKKLPPVWKYESTTASTLVA